LELLLRVLGYAPELQSGWMIGSSYLTVDADLIVIPRFLLAPAFYEHGDDCPLVLSIGDSFTEGYPVEPEDAYPEVLRRRLESHGLRVEVANAGMGDSGPDQQLRLLETRLLPRLHPKVVIWTLYPNDLWDNALKAVYAIADGTLVPTSGASHWIGSPALRAGCRSGSCGTPMPSALACRRSQRQCPVPPETLTTRRPGPAALAELAEFGAVARGAPGLRR
jgi:hypothetical protein